MFDVFDLMATIRLDSSQYEQGLSDAESKASNFGSTLSSGLQTAAKVGTAAVGAAATAVSALTKQSVDSYKEYEQLVGGVETLFDNTENAERYIRTIKAAGATAEEIADAMADANKPVETVMENAANAYKTAGMSANEYMETVTSMAAALNQSTGDLQVSAEMADMAITDMSDNANKMGTSMESIQNAYNGFTKQNFTMLDNLKLGYGGTKEEMQRLLEDAQAISGVEYDVKSYADIVDAIHVIQTEMGITGTTAKEASDTIAGSAGSIKAAWDNLVTGLADKDADLSKLIGDVVESAKVMLQNIIPVAKQAITGIGNFISEVAPIIAEELPALVDDVLPSLLEAAGSLLQAVIESLPSAVMKLITTISDTIVNNLSGIIESADKMITTLVEEITTNLPKIIDSGMKITNAIITGISNMLPTLIPAAVEIILSLVDALIDNLPQMIDAGIQLTVGLVTGLIDAIPEIIERIPEIIVAIVDALVKSAPKIAEAGVKLLSSLVENLPKIISNIVEAVPKIISGIVKAIGNGFSQMVEAGSHLLSGIGEGLMKGVTGVVDKAKSVAGNILGAVKGFFGIASPSKVFAEIGSFLMQGLADGIDVGSSFVEKAIDDVNEGIFDSIGGDGGSYEDILTTTTTTSMGGSGGFGDTTNNLLEEILSKMDSMNVLLDGSVIAGQITTNINDNLGVVSYHHRREAIVL